MVPCHGHTMLFKSRPAALPSPARLEASKQHIPAVTFAEHLRTSIGPCFEPSGLNSESLQCMGPSRDGRHQIFGTASIGSPSIKINGLTFIYLNPWAHLFLKTEGSPSDSALQVNGLTFFGQ